MSITAAKLNVEFGSSGVDGVKRDMDGINLKLGAIGTGLMVAGQQWTQNITKPILGMITDAYMGAAGFEQAIGKVEAVYGQSAQSVLAWSENSANAFGMSQTAALDMVGTYGQIMQAQGMAQADSQEYSKTLIGLAADMSAFSDRDISQSSNAIRAALTGEYESLKSFGIVLKATEVDQEALNLARAEGTDEITEAHRVQARFNIIMRQTSQMHGQFEREATGASGSLARFRANLTDLTTSMGSVLLPIGTKVTNWLNDLVQGLMKMPQWMQVGVVAVLALVAAIGPLLIGVGALAVGIAALPAAFAAVSAVLVPLLPIIAAVTVAIGALFAAYKTNFLGFGDLVDGALGKLGQFTDALDILLGKPDKNVAVTTTFDGNAHYIQDITLPDGTKKWDIIEDETGGTFGSVLESYADEENPRIAHIKIQPTGDGEAFWTTVDLDTGKIESVEIEVTAPGVEETTNAIKKAIAFAEILQMIDPWENLQKGSDKAMEWLNKMGRKFTSLIPDIDGIGISVESAWTTISVTAELILGGIQTLVETVVGAISDAVQAGINGLNDLIDIANKVPGINIGKVGGDDGEGEDSSSGDVTRKSRDPNMAYPSGDMFDFKIGREVGGFLKEAADAAGLFDQALAGLDKSTLLANSSLNATASVTPMVGGAMTTTAGEVQGAGGSMGATFGTIASTAVARFTEAKNVAIAQLTSMNTGGTGQASSMAASVGGHMLGMQTRSAVQMALMASQASTQGSAMNTSLTGWISGAVARIAAGLSGIPGIIRSVGSAGADAGYYAGSMISQGFASGMLAYLGMIEGAANAMVNAASRAVIAKAMISSPSRLFKQYGAYIGEGMELGILGSIPDISRAADQMIGASVPSYGFDASIRGGGYGGGTIVHNHYYKTEAFTLTSEEWLARQDEIADRASAQSARMFREAGDLVGGMAN